jgi:enoyl-CoA hydratase
MDGPVRFELDGDLARITMDDGKLNVMSLALLEALDAAFGRAAAAGAIVLFQSGRDGIFSAGFDLKVFAANDPAASSAMVRAGAELALKVFSHPAPVVTVCAGHAYPMGAFLILASDIRLGVGGPWRIGFNEVAIGIPVPSFALALGRHRLTPAWFERTAVTGQMCPAEEAAAAGFVDRLAPPADAEAAIAEALAQARQAHAPSHRTVKERVRRATAAAMREAIGAELSLEAYRRRAQSPPTVRLPA